MIATRIYNVGFTDLVSVIPPDGEISPNSRINESQRGKVPGLLGTHGWYGYSWDTDDGGSRLARRIDETGANVGLRARRFPGLDIDVEEPDLTMVVAHVAKDVLGFAPHRMSREPRRMLMYRSDEPLKKSRAVITYKGRGHTVELLADGQQYLIHGTHPSGTKYRWDRFPPKPEALTVITAEDVARFWQALEDKLADRVDGFELIGAGEPGGSEGLEIPDDIIEGGRNVMLARIAGSFRRQNLSWDAALLALQAENEARCHPPLDAEEVERILQSIWRYEPSPTADEEVPPEAEFTVVDLEEKPAPKRTELKPLLARPGGKVMKEKSKPIQWLVEGVLPSSEMSVLAAKPKVGKSTIARALAVSVATGRDWMGWPVTQGTVLYMLFPGEGTEDEWREEMHKLGLDPDSPEANNVWLYNELTLEKPEVFHKRLQLLIDEIEPDLIIVDTLQKLARTKKVEDYAEQERALSLILAMAKDTHFMVLTHSPKSASDDPIDAPIGSIQISGSAETVLALRRGATSDHKTRYLRGVGRQIGELEERVIKIDPETHIPTAVLADDYTDNKYMDNLIAALADGPVLKKDLPVEAKGRTYDLREVMKHMIAKGLLIETGSGEPNDPKLIRLPEATDDFGEVPDEM